MSHVSLPSFFYEGFDLDYGPSVSINLDINKIALRHTHMSYLEWDSKKRKPLDSGYL